MIKYVCHIRSHNIEGEKLRYFPLQTIQLPEVGELVLVVPRDHSAMQTVQIKEREWYANPTNLQDREGGPIAHNIITVFLHCERVKSHTIKVNDLNDMLRDERKNNIPQRIRPGI